MSLYRIKQFYWSMFPKVEEQDLGFAKKHLSEYEMELFKKLSKNEQRHSIKVARSVIMECRRKGVAENRLVRAALLHDIGKIECSLNIFDKSILVIMDKLTKGRIRKYKGSKKIDVYSNHGYKGYELLKSHIQDKELLNLIKNHHNMQGDTSEELKILVHCDNSN